MVTTKFEITMIVDVVDVGDVQASAGVLHSSVIKAVEGISTGDIVKVIEAHTSQKTFPKAGLSTVKLAKEKIKTQRFNHKLNS